MRIIIELEGGGSAQPEVVLRSSSSSQGSADATARSPVVSGSAIDAGPAPTGEAGTRTTAAAVIPAARAMDAAGASSAGAAPSQNSGEGG